MKSPRTTSINLDLKVRSLSCYEIYLMKKLDCDKEAKFLKFLGKIIRISRIDAP